MLWVTVILLSCIYYYPWLYKGLNTDRECVQEYITLVYIWIYNINCSLWKRLQLLILSWIKEKNTEAFINVTETEIPYLWPHTEKLEILYLGNICLKHNYWFITNRLLKNVMVYIGKTSCYWPLVYFDVQEITWSYLRYSITFKTF